MANILNFPDSGQLGENDHFYSEKNGIDTKSTYKDIPVATNNNSGLLSLSLYRTLMFERGSATADNIDLLTTPGTYYYYNTLPNELPMYSCLLVLGAKDICIQMILPLHNPTRIFYRSANGYSIPPGWEKWVNISIMPNTFSLSEYKNTLTDSASNNYSPPPQIPCQSTANQAVIPRNLQRIQRYRITPTIPLTLTG